MSQIVYTLMYRLQGLSPEFFAGVYDSEEAAELATEQLLDQFRNPEACEPVLYESILNSVPYAPEPHRYYKERDYNVAL